MLGGASAQADGFARSLFEALTVSAPLLLTGPPRSGKTHTLRALSEYLNDEGVPHLLVAASAPDALDELRRLPAEALLLLDDYTLAPFELLHATALRITAGQPVVGAADDVTVLSDYREHLDALMDRVPDLSETLNRGRTVRLEPLSDDQIARIVHRAASDRLDALTVSTIQRLSWGRPGWAIDLLQLSRNGSLAAVPVPRLRQLSSNGTHAALREPAHLAASTLSAEEVAASIVLSEIGPRSLSGVIDVVGSKTQAALVDIGFLRPSPAGDGLFGVPELYAAAVTDLTTAELLAHARHSAAEHLLAQVALDLPLSDREEIFCARVLSGRAPDRPRAVALQSQHADFMHRTVADLIAFGEGHEARDLLLRFREHSLGLDALARARLTTVLRDAHAGLKTLLTTETENNNSGIPPTDSDTRTAFMFLRSRLAAEAGLPFDGDTTVSDESAGWADACLVARRWNDTDPLGDDLASLVRIARTHTRQDIALLAEQLLAFDAAAQGVRHRSLSRTDVDQRIAQLAITSGEMQRDALECVAVAQALIDFLSLSSSTGEAQLFALTDRLPGSIRHRMWATHLHAASVALVCGDLDRVREEWNEFARRVPRFLPVRLMTAIGGMIPSRPDDNPEPSLKERGTQVGAYFSGRLDTVRSEFFAPAPVARGSVAGLPDDMFDEIEVRSVIRGHLAAHRAQNPLALMRAADALAAHGLWAPAMFAARAARRIFLRRRASGSVSATDAKLAELHTKAMEQAPWFTGETLPDPSPERLTPRETEAARLAATGLTNREIAEWLKCSVRTVESHLAQARAKLGVASREELAPRLEGLGYETGPLSSVASALKRESR